MAVRLLRGPRRRRGPRRETLPARLWYPEGARLRVLAERVCRPDAVAMMARIEQPVPGTLAIESHEGREEATFWVRGQALVPVVTATGVLFLTWAATPPLLNRPVADSDDTVTAWLAVPEDVPLKTRARLADLGWRIGRPRG